MTKEEFNLSEKGEWNDDVGGPRLNKVYEEEDIKEFIRLLKEESLPYLKCEEGIVEKFDAKIDKLAGKELI